MAAATSRTPSFGGDHSVCGPLTRSPLMDLVAHAVNEQYKELAR